LEAFGKDTGAQTGAETLLGRTASDARASGKPLNSGLLTESGPIPERAGRFQLRRRLGHGAMGIVYAGYDETLDRKVAIKFIDARRAQSEHARARMLREAQAMARLSHPGVVQVYEAGEEGGRVFIAMELVDGQTLREWFASEARVSGWQEVLSRFVKIAAGLAAAHEAGVVHRDFKPDNVLLTRDGQPKVADFGLAGFGPAEREPDASDSLPDNVDLTSTGSFLGTPRYMAPEQHLRRAADAKSDQFSFCVALWEGLFGERPYSGATPAILADRVTRGERRAPPTSVNVPTWLTKVCERGLAVEPDQRWSSMTALLDAIRRGQATTRRKRIGVLVAVALLGTVGVFAAAAGDEARRISNCEAVASDERDTLWSDEIRHSASDGILGSGWRAAQVAADKALPRLDVQADALAKHREQSCLFTTVDKRWQEATMAKATWCLDGHALALAALARQLEGADEQIAQEAVMAAAGLGNVASCIDEASLARSPPPPDANDREALRNVRKRIADANAAESAGKYELGLATARQARTLSQALGWPPLMASAREVEARLLNRLGRHPAAESAAVDAYMLASEAGAWRVAASAATELVYGVGYRQSRFAEGRTWARHAEVAASLAGGPHALASALLLGHRGLLERAAGEYSQAQELHEQALAVTQDAAGVGHPATAASLSNLGAVHEKMGEYAKAKAVHERTLKLRTEALGPLHPDVATSLNALGVVHASLGDQDTAIKYHQRAHDVWLASMGPAHHRVGHSLGNMALAWRSAGEYERAEPFLRKSLAVLESALGPEHFDVARTQDNLAIVLQHLGKLQEAETLHMRSIETLERTVGEDHPSIANGLTNLAILHQANGKPDLATPMLERALAIRERRLGPEHREVAQTLLNLALMRHFAGDYAGAQAGLLKAIKIFETALGTRHPHVGVAYYNLAEAQLAQGHIAEAVPSLQQSVSIADEHDSTMAHDLRARFALAKALVDTGGDVAEALTQARAALEGYRDGGSDANEDRIEVEAWIQAHG